MINRRGFIATAVASAFPGVALPITPIQSVQAAAGFASPQSWQKCLEMSMAEYERAAKSFSRNSVYGAYAPSYQPLSYSDYGDQVIPDLIKT